MVWQNEASHFAVWHCKSNYNILHRPYLKSLESADRCLREHVAVESAECQTDIGLCESQLDAALFELARERLEVV